MTRAQPIAPVAPQLDVARLIACTPFGKLNDRLDRPVRGTTLKVVLLSVWACEGQLTHFRDFAAHAGCSVSQAFRAMEALMSAGLVLGERLERPGRSRFSPRGRYTVNRDRLIAIASGKESAA